MKILDRVAIILLVIAGLIWGTVGVADYNLIMWVFIDNFIIQHLIYILFGLAAIWVIIRSFKHRKSR